MIQREIKRIESSTAKTYVFFNSGLCVTSYKGSHYDFELDDMDSAERSFINSLQNLPSNIKVRLTSLSDFDLSKSERGTARDEVFSSIGQTRSGLIVSFEKSFNIWGSLLSRFTSKKLSSRFFEEFVAEFEQEIRDEIVDSFCQKWKPTVYGTDYENQIIESSRAGLKVDGNFLSVVKLHRTSKQRPSEDYLTYLREIIPLPNMIVTTAQRVDEKKEQFVVKTIAEREKTGTNVMSYARYEASQELTKEIEINGNCLVAFETSIIIRGSSEEKLVEQANRIKNRLKAIGDFGVEAIGCYPAFKQALPGGKTHIPQNEVVDRIFGFAPTRIRGNDKPFNTSSGSFLFHRSNFTVDHLYPFNKAYANYSGIISGKSGLGKSVFANGLIDSLMNDPNTKIMLVDVKGSHTRMVQSRGGVIHNIGTKQKSALSPFKNVNPSNVDTDTIEILADWLEKLLLENGEEYLTQAEQAKIESSLKQYFESKPKVPSLQGFASFSKDLPRKDSLGRWLVGGIYEHMFSDHRSDEIDSRLEYLNFSNIVTAQKGGVGVAVMNTAQANFYLKLMNKQTNEKLVFLIDESPFFIKNCFSGLRLIMKNIRKMNGSLIIVSQDLLELIVEINGKKDRTLVQQPSWRIFFSADEGSSNFKEDSGLSLEGIEKLSSLHLDKGKCSRFLIKDHFGERLGSFYQTKSEYFRSTTESYDLEKIENVREALGLEDNFQAAELLGTLGA